MAAALLALGALPLTSPAHASICGRTEAVRNAIVGKVSGVTNCADITSSHLSGITGGLDVSSASLTSLQEDDFDGLTSLQTLDLEENSLSSLHEDIFDGLTALNTLELSNNSLSSLDEEIFDGVTALQWLYLYNNRLRSLPQGLLSSTRLPNLANLQLSNNGLVCLPRDLAGRSSIIQDTTKDLPDCYGVSLSVSSTEVSEGSGGETITVTATLKDGNRVKTEATTVTISVKGGSASEGADFDPVSDFAITIASGSSSNSGTFTLTARKDAVADDNETVKVRGRTGLSNSSVAGTEVDEAEVSIRNTPHAVDLSATSLTAMEEGETGTYTVVLDTLPTGNVTITPVSGNTTVATVTPPSLTFTTSNWDTPQTVTVSSVENDVDGEDQTITVSHGISGGGYGSISVDHVTVTVNDDDTAGVSISPTSLSMSEGDADSYTVVLESEPTGTVTITASSSDTTVATVAPSSLTFTTSNWDTAQTVTVSSVENDVDGEDQTITVSHGISGGGYGSVSVDHVTVTVNDDDTAGVSISPTSLSMSEGDAGSYTVVLESEPTGTVTITASSSDTTVATVTPPSLTFTTSNWDTAQTVTVSGVENDVDGEDQTITVSHGVSGGGYGSVSVDHVSDSQR